MSVMLTQIAEFQICGRPLDDALVQVVLKDDADKG